MTAELTTCLDAAADATDFRPIQYLGSKWRLLDDIESVIAPLVPAHRPAVCDLFTGTGVVAARLARARPVVAADVQEYARVLASALLNPAHVHVPDVVRSAREAFQPFLTPSVGALFDLEARYRTGTTDASVGLCDLLEHGSIEAGTWASSSLVLSSRLPAAAAALELLPYSAITRHYGGVYFSYLQAAHLDALTTTVHAMPAEVKDTCIAALLSTASELVSSVGGHFAQPIRPRAVNGHVKPGIIDAISRSRRIDTFTTFERWLHRYGNRAPARHTSAARRADFRAVLHDLPPSVGCVYADPPYTRDHYSRFYHVLETLALRDDPGLSTMVLGGRTLPSRGLYRKDRHQSPFSIVSQAPAAFNTMFALVAERETSLVLSYSPIPETDKPRARVTTLEVLCALAEKHFSTVKVRPINTIAHAKLNAQRLNAMKTFDAEVLLIAQP